ncbi:MAG: hypothetical protein Q7U54_12040 [Bacteroidales bacterium]|nr:hypothetical protein [Bacteroidales bacterium]
METKSKKSLNYYMRSLHRDIGFIIVGLTIIYSISGIVLIYRETGFLKHVELIEKQLSTNINETELGGILRIRNMEGLKTEGDVVSFKNGTYNKKTGIVKYSENALPTFLEKLNNLHKTSDKGITHWFITIFAVLLLFLAVSSFWMFKPNLST